ncbi:DUF2249 domain-containing protein [Kaistella sp.]|uniref:DUF2249 domain-containing protein n=1 Tax=Kaistella sp. TaxID=2782235 RepID=UPI002F92485C
MKTISMNTKISELIKENSGSVDAIASIAKPLEKLKNPILRKIMASRVTIAEASKMTGTKVDDFKRVLSPLGFIFEGDESAKEESPAKPKPSWLQNASKEIIDFYDVRPIIDDGADPLKEILHRFKEVKPGEILCVINGFMPTPLIHLLKQEKAEDTFVETISDKEFHTYFLKKKKEAEMAGSFESKLQMNGVEAFNGILAKFSEDQIRRIDVRGLEMPGPMHTILGELEKLPEGNALFIDHKRVPVYLLEELADKDFEVHIHNVAEGDVKMLIFRK